MGSSPCQVKSKTLKFLLVASPLRINLKTVQCLFAASPLRTQYLGVRAKIDCLGIRIMCPSGATCLSVELAKCGVIWLSEFRGKYLNMNVLRGTTADGRTDDKL